MLWHENNISDSCDCENIVKNSTTFSLRDTQELLTRYSCDQKALRTANANMIREASRNNKAAILSQFLNVLLHDPATINDVDSSGRTALMWASQRGHVHCVKLLLDSYADPNLRNQFGYTALILACLRGHFKCAELLLYYGADANIRNDEGKTALECTKNEDIRIHLLCHELKTHDYHA
jgi:ankyrin repeat protein